MVPTAPTGFSPSIVPEVLAVDLTLTTAVTLTASLVASANVENENIDNTANSSAVKH
jgi:hypothetical protein